MQAAHVLFRRESSMNRRLPSTPWQGKDCGASVGQNPTTERIRSTSQKRSEAKERTVTEKIDNRFKRYNGAVGRLEALVEPIPSRGSIYLLGTWPIGYGPAGDLGRQETEDTPEM